MVKIVHTNDRSLKWLGAHRRWREIVENFGGVAGNAILRWASL
jgi:hypothetical protein